MCKGKPVSRNIYLCLVIVAVVLSVAVPVRSASVDDDFTFASGLVKLGFADLAQRVIDEVVRLHPDQKGRANIIKAEGLIAQRKFADAEALVQSMESDPKADSIRLALANGYYRAGEVDKAKGLYNAYFSKHQQPPTDQETIRFYRDASYTYGQMQEQSGDLQGAIDAYGRVLLTNPEKDIARRIMSDQAGLYVRASKTAQGDQRGNYLHKAEDICNNIFWGGVDLWFGQAVITLANIKLAWGDKAAAQKTLKDYDEMLKQLDDFLKEQNMLSQSPMAGVRFMKGELIQEQADAIKGDPAKRDEAIALYGQALGEFYNVFIKYGDSDWGPEAGIRANTVKKVLEDDFGKTVNIDLGSLEDKAVQTQFRLADNLSRQKKFAEAIPEYIKGVNLFPETEVSVRALGALATAYAEIGDTLMVKVVTSYIAERFTKSDSGAVALLGLGKLYFDKKDAAMYTQVYETYLSGYPKHDRAGAILYTLAGLKKQAGDEAAATAYFERIARDYKQDQYYPKALIQLGWGYYKLGQYDKAIEGFRQLVKDTPPSPDVAQAQFNLADCYIRLERHAEAAAELETLLTWIVPKDNAYASTPEGVAKNKKLLERTIFQRAICYTRIKEPADQIATFRDKALRGFDQFLQVFPQSELAPKALNGRGRVQLELGQIDAATKTFDDLAAKYPNSEEGKNALYSLASSALEIKQVEQAKLAFGKMMQNAATYKPEEFVRIGQLMLDNGVFDEAVRAFQQVESQSQERLLLERSLFGIGQAYLANKQYAESAKALESLMEKYPKSGLFYQAKFSLGEAYTELGRTEDGMKAINDVLRYAEDDVLRNQASFKLATLQRKGGDLKAALASYQRIALLADLEKEELRPLIESSIVESLAVATELKQYVDVQEICDQYLKLFPSGARVEEMRKAKADARLKAAEAGAPAAPVKPAGQ